MNYVTIAWWDSVHTPNDADIWHENNAHTAIRWCKQNCKGYDAAMICDRHGNIVFKLYYGKEVKT